MLKPSFAFTAGGALASLSWLCLSASLFIACPLRSAVWNGTTIAVPAFLGLQGFRTKNSVAPVCLRGVT